MSCGRRFAIAWILLLLAGGSFVRQALFHPYKLWDFGVFYAASHVWLNGGNPYDAETIWRWWEQQQHSTAFALSIRPLPPVAPPPALAVFAPLALAPPTVAARIWIVLCLGLLFLQFMAQSALARLELYSPATLLLIAATLLLYPLALAMMAGQTALPAAAMIVVAVWAAQRSDRQRFAGAMLGIAAALKLQLALPFIITLPYLRRPRAALWAIAVVMVLLAIAVFPIRSIGLQWTDAWTTDLVSVSTAGGLNDFGSSNASSYQLLNLQLPLFALLKDRRAANLVSITIGILLYAVLLIAVQRRRRRVERLRDRPATDDHLLIAAILAPLLLLPIYHRYYDGVILALTVAWVFREVRRGGGWQAWSVGLLLATALIPPASAAPRLLAHLPNWLADSRFSQGFIIPYRVWLLFFAVLILLSTFFSDRDELIFSKT